MSRTIEGERLKEILAAYKINVSEFADAWGVSRAALYNRLFKRTLTPTEMTKLKAVLADSFRLTPSTIADILDIPPDPPAPSHDITLQESINRLADSIDTLTQILIKKWE